MFSSGTFHRGDSSRMSHQRGLLSPPLHPPPDKDSRPFIYSHLFFWIEELGQLKGKFTHKWASKPNPK